MIIYGFPKTRALRAVWTAEEAGVAYDYRHVDLMKGEARTREFLRLNLAGKVPVLIDEDMILTESAAICNYIARSRPEQALVPTDLHGLARFEQWCSFVETELEQPLWTIAKHRYALAKELRVPAVIDTAKWEYERALKVMQRGINDGEYLVWDEFTVADIMVIGNANGRPVLHDLGKLNPKLQPAVGTFIMGVVLVTCEEQQVRILDL